MPKLQKFLVEFDNPAAVYYPGQTVNGRILIILNEEMKIKEIRLNLSGKAHTRWKITKDHTTRQESESYFDSDMVLLGSGPGSKAENSIMKPGSYQFPFSFLLPPSCPSSYEGGYGYIRYLCLATIDLPWKVNETSLRAFTVISLVDLNITPYLGLPVGSEQSKTLGFFCCKSGTIKCSLKIPRSGFVSGEVIPINMEIVNTSSTRISQVNVCIEEYAIFFAKNYTRDDVRLVAQVKKGSIEPGKIQIWKNEGVKIPPVAPTLTNCRLIKINYMLTLSVDPAGMHADLSFKIPIVIGNVPLRVAMQELNRNYGQPQIDGPPSAMPLAADSYRDLPPSSHQEHVFGLTNILDDDGHTALQFAPRHTYYDWSQP